MFNIGSLIIFLISLHLIISTDSIQSKSLIKNDVSEIESLFKLSFDEAYELYGKGIDK
jgi:hypothetical protein